ncbi:MAG: 2-amino-4-hydroxy-6-hydroxymethyldihydropteridine diphosphokinase [Oscillospiraceae bacterium]|nr:2-amino-4-hydroxy-6-hydroxymethyldihydropteridine diphosphokinase [Oscillospiraceae bacterium]MDD3833191.1 2-amino-4-hydroxy-6-hydroxymethyldihydropteridine diphosphokinase [Oscillospiraceae bacterium]MDD4546270.1 2-amino-4-hydroxy-6-hydroxymethyldihydropteridine diphosphokinase [Oscillospiraceae bacterium]
MSLAVLSLGSNIGNREQNIRAALNALSALPKTRNIKLSEIYQTLPEGYTDQPLFLNAVAVIQTELSPRALLGACLGIEAAMGRIRNFKNGPRIIDIDVLVYEGETANDSELILPHPRMGNRGFVLVPLADLFPDGNVLGMDFKNAISKAKGRSDITRYNNA